MEPIPAEGLTKDALDAQRVARYKRREAWERKEDIQKVIYEAGCSVGTATEQLEDVLKDLNREEMTDAQKAERIAAVRKTARGLSEFYRKLETAAKHGWNLAMEVYEQADQGEMSEEEAKRLKKLLKKKEEEDKEKGKKYKIPKRERNEEPDSPEKKKPAPGWGEMMNPQLMMLMAAMAGGGQGMASMMKPDMATGSRPTESRRKAPCHNCGGADHWAYQIQCPNYHLYLAQQAAKAEAQKKIGGQQTAKKEQTGKNNKNYIRVKHVHEEQVKYIKRCKYVKIFQSR